MNPEDDMLVLARDFEEQGDAMRARMCRRAAFELERLYAERRHYLDSSRRNIALRVEAEARAGRIARDARR